MTFAEVVDILGPPGDYRSGPTVGTGGLEECDPKIMVTMGKPVAECDHIWFYYRRCEPVGALWQTDRATILLTTCDCEKTGRDIDIYRPPPSAYIYSGALAHTKLENGWLSNVAWQANRLRRRWFPDR